MQDLTKLRSVRVARPKEERENYTTLQIRRNSQRVTQKDSWNHEQVTEEEDRKCGVESGSKTGEMGSNCSKKDESGAKAKPAASSSKKAPVAEITRIKSTPNEYVVNGDPSAAAAAAASTVPNGEAGKSAAEAASSSALSPATTSAGVTTERRVSFQDDAPKSGEAAASAPSASPPPAEPSASKNVYGRSTVNYDLLEREAQRENYLNLKENYLKNQHQFLVDLLLLSVQFFKNFDRDKEAIRNLKLDTESHLRESISDMRFKPIVSDAIFHKILDHVGFRSKDANNVLEPLLPTEYHIAYYFVETHRREDFERLANGSMEYSTVEEPHYRTCVEKAGRIGYAKLRCVDSYDDLVPDSSSDPEMMAAINGGHSPRPGSPALGRRKADQTAASSTTTKKDNILYDHIPTPIEQRRKHQKEQIRRAVDGAITEEEDDGDDDDNFETGEDFLRSIHDRLRGDTPNLSARPSLSRTSPLLGLGHRGSGGGGGPRLMPQNENSDPVFSRQSSQSSNRGEASQQQQQQQRAASATLKPPAARTSSGSSTPQSIYGETESSYGYLRTRPKDLQSAVAAGLGFGASKRSALPARCFKEVDVDPDADDVEDVLDPYPAAAAGAARTETRVFLSSRQVMQHFAQQFDSLARKMGKGDLVPGAKLLDPRVICREERASSGADDDPDFAKEDCLDFVPSVEVGFWPDESIDFYLKKRPKVRDKRTSSIYTWPSPEIVSQAQQIGFNLVPVGFVEPRKGHRPTAAEARETGIQWRLQFTKLEGLIQRNLNHPKVRCFLFALLVFKTHLEHLNSVTPEHIRHMFYWMVEKNPAKWTEENLGENLLQLIRSMKGSLKTQRLPNYFLSKENLFDQVPRHKLAQANEKFYRLQENLIPYLMSAFKRLHYDRGFYPMLDVAKLNEILTTRATLAILNPALVATIAQNTQNKGGNAFQRSRLEAELRRKARSDPAQERMREQHRQRVQEQQRRQRELAENSNEEADEDRIDLNMSVPELDPTRGRLVLEFFASHFLALARRSNDFRADGQCRLYLNAADNLVRLMKELKLYGAGHHMELQEELEHLRQVSRATARDYWEVSWGPSRLSPDPVPSSSSDQNSRPMNSVSSVESGQGNISAQSSFKDGHHEQPPLPHVPKGEPSPIPGTEDKAAKAAAAVAVDDDSGDEKEEASKQQQQVVAAEVHQPDMSDILERSYL